MIDKEKLPILHSIRGFAALMVVICHAKFVFWSGGKEYVNRFPVSDWNVLDYAAFVVDMLSSNGHAMVMLFFLLSGFFIAYSFQKNQWTLSEFYFSRFLRIYIPYFASLLVCVAAMLLAHNICPSLFSGAPSSREYNMGIHVAYQDLFTWQTLYALIFMKGDHHYIGFNHPYWSLLVECLFYIVVPFIVFRKKIFFYLSLVGLMAYLVLPLDNQIIVYVLSNFFYFAVGFVLFEAVVIRRWRLDIPWVNAGMLTVLAVGLVLLGQLLFFVEGLKELSYLISGLSGCFMIYTIICYPIKDNVLLRVLKSLGKVSYSMYLIHFPLFMVMYAFVVRYSDTLYSYSRTYWLAIVLYIPFAYLFYYLVEEKSLDMITAFKKRISVKK